MEWLADSGGAARRTRHVKERRAANRRDAARDERLAALEQELSEVGALLAALVALLRDKKVVTDAELHGAIERAAHRVQRTTEARAADERAVAEASRRQLAEARLERVRRRKRP